MRPARGAAPSGDPDRAERLQARALQVPRPKGWTSLASQPSCITSYGCLWRGPVTDVIRSKPHLFLGSRLKRLAERMQGDVGLVAQRTGITIQTGQYPLLATLDEDGPQTIGELARSLGQSQPAVTKTAERLLEAGLIDVARGESDRRQRRVSLSPAGQRIVDRSRREVWPLVEAAVREATEGLAGPRLDQIGELERRLEAYPLNHRATAASTGPLEAATDADLPPIVALMNRAYRGGSSQMGWATEAGYIDGSRTTLSLIREELRASPDATFLPRRTRSGGELLGCVCVEPQGDGIWYLGSLTVDPQEQNRRLGRALLSDAEDWIRARGGHEVGMTVVHLREGLIAWYQRRGYALTGETKPFPYGDERFGTPRRDDLHFVVLRKRL